MLRINERPNITEVLNTDEGYRTRTLCVVDGFPAEISIEVNHDNRQRYSSFDLSYYDYVDGRWRSLYSLNPREVGRMPMIGDDPETLVRLNEVATTLWQVATTILRTARQRAEELDLNEHRAKQAVTESSRTVKIQPGSLVVTTPDSELYNPLGQLSPSAQAFTNEQLARITELDDALAGEPEFAPDASDEERQG